MSMLYTLVLVTLVPGSPQGDLAHRFQEHMPGYLCERDARWFNAVHIPDLQRSIEIDDLGGALCVPETAARGALRQGSGLSQPSEALAKEAAP